MTIPEDPGPSNQGYLAASADTEENAAGAGPAIQDCPRPPRRMGLRRAVNAVTRWFGRPRAANGPSGPPDPDAYKIHWVWVGGDLSAEAQQNVVAWTNTFHTDVAPVLWVDDAALDRLRDGGRVKQADGKTLLRLPGMGPAAHVEIKNIDSLDAKGVPGWDRLGPAAAHEATDDHGLRQVSSDIVRVAVLWHEGGAYWDLGDTAPSAHRFSPKKLSPKLLGGGPAVIPQVLGEGTKRTENGIILTNPHKQAEARQHYETMLNEMAAQYPTPHARTTAVRALVQQWKTEVHDGLDTDNLAHAKRMASMEKTPGQLTHRYEAQLYVRDHLDDVHNPRDADRVMTDALRRSGPGDHNVQAIVAATRNQDEGAYFDGMTGGLGAAVNPKFLPQHTSLTVNDHTFGTFVHTTGSQVEGAELGDKAANLDAAGWSKVQRYFGGNTKAGSWYSWKTGPGRALAADPGTQG